MNLSDSDTTLLRRFFADKPVKRAYLFGSYARNSASEGSDIDLLLELDYTQHIGFLYVQMVLDLENLLHRKVDLVALDGLSDRIKSYVDKDKILIYDALS